LHYRKIPSYSVDVPRRKPGSLLPLETEVLHVALAMLRAGDPPFHGFGLAQAMRKDGAGGLIGHGTLYKALGRLEEMGLLTSRWEDAPPAGRPRRRLYELTAAGAEAANAPRPVTSQPKVRRRLAPRTT
jgi:PadR family transcriptional regulator, regulatory protein PadR